MGDTDIGRQLDGGSHGGVRLRASLNAGYQTGSKTYAGTQQVATPGGVYDLRVRLLTLVAGADLWTGTGAGLVLPMGRITHTDSTHDQTDNSLGDLEVRVRQDLQTLLGWSAKYAPRLTLAAGMVAPTGSYIGKKVAAFDPSEDVGVVVDPRYSSLGRGVWWLIGDIDLFGRIANDFGWFVSIWTRWPLGQASNGFIWGNEERVSLGGAWRAVPDRLALTLSVDWQRRDKASEVLPDVLTQTYKRSEFLNGGGDWLEISPAVRVDLTRQFALTALVHQPLYRNVVGLQGVTDTAYFLSLSWGFTLGGPERPTAPVFAVGQQAPPELAAKLAPGKTTLLDYWASWCEPCQRLSTELEAFARTRPDVAVVRVDATAWLQEEMDAFLPGCAGLPVLDAYDPEGRLRVRLIGTETFGYRDHVPLSGSATATAP